MNSDPDAALRAYRQGVEDATTFPYQKTFDAIAAATSISCGTIAISVIKFREVFGLLSGASNERAAEKCFRCGHAAHSGPCVNVAPRADADQHVEAYQANQAREVFADAEKDSEASSHAALDKLVAEQERLGLYDEPIQSDMLTDGTVTKLWFECGENYMQLARAILAAKEKKS